LSLSGYTGERLFLTLWVGALWAIGYLAVPMAFISMDTVTAGDYAGRLFQAVNMLGIVSAVMLLIARWFRQGFETFYRYWRTTIIVLMLLISVIFMAYLQPEMQQMKALGLGTSEALSMRFAAFHKYSEMLYLMLSLFGLLLVLTTDARMEQGKTDGEK
jgi:hypothetical protein